MATESSDPITAAMIATEKEVAGFAWDIEDTDDADPSGDRSLEGMGEGLEGQHEAEDESDTDGEDADGDDESEAEVLDKDGKLDPELVTEGKGQTEPTKPVAAEKPEGRVPSGKLREANEALRAATAERDALKAQIEKAGGENKSLADKLDLVMREIDGLKRAPRTEVKAADPPKPETIPDIFEDPKGFAEHLTKGFQTELSKRDKQLNDLRVENSMAVAHARHGETFEKAFAAINKLNVNNPDDLITVQRIYRSPNPGDALVSWHKRSQTLAEVGDDPAAFREKVAKETREALMKDPEFRKQLVAEMRGDAARGDDGTPRTTTRLPNSLARAQGSNVGTGRVDPNAGDDSPQAIAEAAWR